MKTVLICMAVGLFAVANAAQLPFSETFNGLTNGALNGQNAWAVQNGTAVVQTDVAQAGKAVELSSSSVSHAISSANSAVWLTFWSKYTGMPGQNPAVTNVNTSLAFYINTNGTLVVYSNTTPVTLSTVIPTNVWIRFDIYCDYAALKWDLSVNKTNVAAGLPLYSASPQLASLLLQNESGTPVYVDEIAVTDIEPTTDIIDGDGDGIPDWWEQKYFGGITAASPGSPASNGVNTVGGTYIAGLNPLGADRFWISGGSRPGGQFSWIGQPGRYYSVHWTTNLTAGFTLLQANIPWTQNVFTDVVRTNAPAGFYQVRVGL